MAQRFRNAYPVKRNDSSHHLGRSAGCEYGRIPPQKALGPTSDPSSMHICTCKGVHMHHPCSIHKVRRFGITKLPLHALSIDTEPSKVITPPGMCPAHGKEWHGIIKGGRTHHLINAIVRTHLDLPRPCHPRPVSSSFRRITHDEEER